MPQALPPPRGELRKGIVRPMDHSEGTFVGAGGIHLYYQAWTPDGPPRGVLAAVHGVAEHSGRYVNVVNALVPRGYVVVAYDQRRHGRSPGQRVHINRWQEYRDDLRAFLHLVGEQGPGHPMFIYGHSMGALVVLDYLLFYQDGLRGAVISGAPLEPVGVAKPYLVAAARLLSPIIPRLPIKTHVDVTAISRDPEVVREYVNDPMVTYVAGAVDFKSLLPTQDYQITGGGIYRLAGEVAISDS